MFADTIFKAASIMYTEHLGTDPDALVDCLFLVLVGEATCGDTFCDVAGPGGEWALGRDDGSVLPPWVTETCVDPTGRTP